MADKTIFDAKVNLGRSPVTGEYAEIHVTMRALPQYGNRRTIDLELAPDDAVEFSMSAGIARTAVKLRRGDWDSGGQCCDELKRLYPGNAHLLRLVEIWERWHLCGMKAGTRAQQECLDAMPADVRKAHRLDWYGWACIYLQMQAPQLRSDRGYVYGNARLCEPFPEDLQAEVKRLCFLAPGGNLA